MQIARPPSGFIVQQSKAVDTVIAVKWNFYCFVSRWHESVLEVRRRGQARALPRAPSDTVLLAAQQMCSFAKRLATYKGRELPRAHRVAGGGRPSPAPTERSMRICRTTLFGK